MRDELLQQIELLLERQPDIFGANVHQFELHERLSVGQVEEFERRHRRVASEVLTFSKIEQGQTVELAETDIVDWTIVDATGTEEGNFVGKLIESIQGRSHQ